MMRSTARNQNLIPEILRRATGYALFLPILLVLALVAIPSAAAQTFTVLHKFTGGWDGAGPGGVIRDARGNLYGITGAGGSFNFGTVFEMDQSGKETVLHNFAGVDGLWPISRLIRDQAGDLYGTTPDGGTPEGGKCTHGCGTVFRVDKTGKQTVLHAFKGVRMEHIPIVWSEIRREASMALPTVAGTRRAAEAVEWCSNWTPRAS
jgi:uncharacterized repeat protein (TIGR03803 family)